MFDTDLSFIFDQSDDLTRKRDVLAVYDAFLRHGDEIKLGGVSFLNSREALHLQAADMFAWEFNGNAHKILENRSETTSTDEYMELGKGVKWMDAQIVRKDTIIRMKDFAINQHSPKTLAVMADYFKEFAPALAGKKRLKRRVDTSASVRADRR